MPESLNQRFKNAEPLGDGLTNEVVITEQDTVIKSYSRYPLTSFYTALGSFLAGRFGYISRKKRMDNEVDLKKIIKDTGIVKAPQVLNRKDKLIEFEKVPGDNCFNYLSICSFEEAEFLGETLSRLAKNLHSQRVALRDFRLTNFHIEDGTIYSIDHEYCVKNSNGLENLIDLITVFSSARQTPNYREFRKSFATEYDVLFIVDWLSAFTSILHSLLIERDVDRVRNAFKNLAV